MMPVTSLALALGCVVSADADAPIRTSELCELLAHQYAAMDGVALRFTIESHYGKGSPMPPDESMLGPQTLTSRHLIETLRTGDRYRIDDDFTFRTLDEGVEEFWPGRKISTWDGLEYRTLRCNLEKPDTGVLDIRLEPAPDVFAGYFMTWQGWWLLHGPDRIGFVELMGRDDLHEPELLSDGRTRWNVGPMAPDIVILARRVPDGIELDEAHFRWYRNNEAATRDDADLTTTMIFDFGPLRKNDIATLPSSCTVRVGNWKGRGPEHDSWGFARIDLIELNTPNADASSFCEPPRPESSIIDQRYRIAYDQGSNTINVDGRILKTHQEVRGDAVGDELEFWVQRGQWVDTIEPVGADTSRPAAPSATASPDPTASDED